MSADDRRLVSAAKYAERLILHQHLNGCRSRSSHCNARILPDVLVVNHCHSLNIALIDCFSIGRVDKDASKFCSQRPMSLTAVS